jgi:hypothetical protein
MLFGKPPPISLREPMIIILYLFSAGSNVRGFRPQDLIQSHFPTCEQTLHLFISIEVTLKPILT